MLSLKDEENHVRSCSFAVGRTEDGETAEWIVQKIYEMCPRLKLVRDCV